MDAVSFIRKWSRSELSEQAASQQHFMDLCALVGVKTPAEVDPTGEVFTFEKAVSVSGAASLGSKGERGYADVWYKDRFVWEYKRRGKYKDLADAYRQVNQYRGELGNPPLLVVSDISRIEIHTNFTGFRPEKIEIALEDLTDRDKLGTLRRVFTDPNSFKPDETPEEVTKRAAEAIGKIAQGLRGRGHDPHAAAHFLMKVMFCLFAEDVELLPRGLFERMLSKYRYEPGRLKAQMDALFEAMRTGGDFGIEEIAYFNGGLFDTEEALELTEEDIGSLVIAASKDWSKVEPSVFGTLFERSLDPAKRAQIGAHYTSRDDIMLVIEPVILRPLKREWEETQGKIAAQLERRKKAKTDATKRKANEAVAELFDGFQQRLSSVRVLDPACGSGNFLYVAIQCLLDLERAVIVAASDESIGLGGLFPRVRPSQLYGIEINPYASELAQVVIWIGYLQWMRDNGFAAPRNPVLEAIETIENRDAILAWEDESGASIPVWREGAVCRGRAGWPEAEFVVGNPPFLGSKQFRRSGLPDVYTRAMYKQFDIPNSSDLCCYWFQSAYMRVMSEDCLRVGLLATQGIRGGSSNHVLKSISDNAQIFCAWSDRDWNLDGAAVRVSIVCFAREAAGNKVLDGKEVAQISSNLSGSHNKAASHRLVENKGLAFQGPVKVGDFDLGSKRARDFFCLPNPDAVSNTEVIQRWLRGAEIVGREEPAFIINFSEMEQEEAAIFEAPFEHVETHVKPTRLKSRDKSRKKYWWRLGRSGRDFVEAVSGSARCIATCQTAKYRIFSWCDTTVLPAQTVIALARSDGYFFGVLHSSVHELWALRQGTQLEDRPRYTPTTCFETFPLPWSPGGEPGEGDRDRGLHDAIGEAAGELDRLRENWLNPEAWVSEIAAGVDAADDFADVARVSGEEARRLIRQSAIDAASAKDPRLKKRTLTNLYNERPTWLRLAHRKLDEAVLAAYAAVDPAGGWDVSWAEVFEETGAGQGLPAGEDGAAHPLAEKRGAVEQAILGALLRLNQERAGA